MQDILPVQNTNNIRLADFVRVTTVNDGIETISLFSTAPNEITVTLGGTPQTFTGLSALVQIGEVQRDIKSTANETSITLVGIDTALLGFVLGQNIKGSKIEMWHGFFDDNGILITNILIYSQEFNNSVWAKDNCTITQNDVLAPDNTLTADRVNRTATGNHFMYQSYFTEPPINKTFTFSVWLKSGTMTGNIILRIRDGLGAELPVAVVTPTSTWTRFSVTGTFGATPSSNINVFIDPANDTGVAGDNYYVWGAQLQETLQPSQYVATTETAQSGLYKFFTGYVNSFSISEQWMEDLRMFVGTINVSASSIQIILQNRTAGRYTNNNAWQFFNAGDTSMARVSFIQSINYFFGKDADPSTYRS